MTITIGDSTFDLDVRESAMVRNAQKPDETDAETVGRLVMERMLWQPKDGLNRIPVLTPIPAQHEFPCRQEIATVRLPDPIT